MFGGSMVALVTPMKTSGEVDFAALSGLIDFHVEQGTDALVVAGTTGESPTLTSEEHAAVIRESVRIARGRIPVIAGTGSNSTRQTLDLSREVDGFGVDGFLLVVPYYNKPNQEGLYQHFRTIAEAVSKPVVLYNVPGRTSCDLKPETVARLSSLENIVAVKEATGDVERVGELREGCGESFEIYSGDDGTAKELMLRGGVGDISVTANVAPAAMHDLCAAASAGDRDRAEEIDARLRPLHRDLAIECNPIPVKWALAEMGLIEPGIRLPLVPLDPQYHEQVRESLRTAGVL